MVIFAREQCPDKIKAANSTIIIGPGRLSPENTANTITKLETLEKSCG
jgi:hypothetical protein